MSGELSKFHGQQNESLYGGPVMWPGAHGLPFRGRQAPLLRKEEFDSKVQVQTDFKARKFKLYSNDEQHADDHRAYQEVMDHIVAGQFILVWVERRYDEVTGALIVLLEWGQQFSQCSDDPHAGSSMITRG